MFKNLYILLIALSLSACQTENDIGIPCTEEALAGLNVAVRDAATEAFITEDIIVRAQSGDYRENLTLLGGVSPIFVGAWEREGIYVVTVIKDGYQTHTSEPLEVLGSECHVIPVFLEVMLQSEKD